MIEEVKRSNQCFRDIRLKYIEVILNLVKFENNDVQKVRYYK